jgi:glycosyltransferase involved in cell wall biosynthesis
VSAPHDQDGSAEAGGLVVHVEWPLPPSLAAGVATAALLSGTCFHRRHEVEGLEILVGGAVHRPEAFGMPRPDVAAAAGDAAARAYRSGFWGVVPIAAPGPGELEVQLAAQLADGSRLVAPAGRIEVEERPPPPPLEARPETEGAPGLIAVCMATFEPDMRLFRAQIASLLAQTDRRWVCLISDDCSSPERYAEMLDVLGDDARFTVSRSEERLGFYLNFERALGLVPAEAELVALCDQDDRWDADKLAVLRDALGDAVLAYSDMRLVDADGRLLRATLWQGRSNNHTNLASMLIANTVGGAAMLFRRDLLALALPFPDGPGFQLHDHWLGTLALASGELAYVDRPLYDYVQHPGAVFGDVSQGTPSSGERRPIPGPAALRAAWRASLDRWRAAYFHGYLARRLQAQTLLLRCSGRLRAPKRRALERFVASGHSPTAWVWLVARSARGLIGRNETLGAELQLAEGILWRRLIPLLARRRRAAYDASMPPYGAFEQRRMRRWRARL